MSRTIVEIDPDVLAAAMSELGTSTVADTVNAALAEVVNVRRRLGFLDDLDHHSDLDDPGVLHRAWA